jgi:hypothetical protein
MASNENDDDSDAPDPLPTPPGVTTEAFGPFGVPVPVPAFDDGSGEPLPENAESADDADPDGGDQPRHAATNPDILTTEGVSDLEAAAELGDEYIDRVKAAMDDETCELCLQILDALRARPIEEQVRGVRELATLKREADTGADPAELAAVMDDFEVIDDPSMML